MMCVLLLWWLLMLWIEERQSTTSLFFSNHLKNVAHTLACFRCVGSETALSKQFNLAGKSPSKARYNACFWFTRCWPFTIRLEDLCLDYLHDTHMVQVLGACHHCHILGIHFRLFNHKCLRVFQKLVLILCMRKRELSSLSKPYMFGKPFRQLAFLQNKPSCS